LSEVDREGCSTKALRERIPTGKTAARGRSEKDRPPIVTDGGPRKSPGPLREYVALHDLADCLLEAYDCVSRRAHQRYIERGNAPGRAMEDWLAAQRELLPSLPTSIQDSGDFVYALASVPGAVASEIAIGLESHWLVILVGSHRAVRSNAHSFCVSELPAKVDPSQSIAILCDGMLAIRMKKLREKE